MIYRPHATEKLEGHSQSPTLEKKVLCSLLHPDNITAAQTSKGDLQLNKVMELYK